MLVVYTLAVGLSAALLFVIEPMVGKMLLPVAGGCPGVWTTCMLFFQTALLCGYAYADVLARRLEPRKQWVAHAIVLALGLAFLPVSLGGPGTSVSGAALTALPLLLALAVAAGAPFFVLSATGPLLQRWLALTDHPDARDPYFLYAASNLGSLGGLLAYPFVLEPTLRLRTPDASLFPPRWIPISQSTLWTAGYVLLAGLVLVCGLLMIRRPGHPIGATSEAVEALPRGAYRRWLILSLVPSSAMLGVTQYLTTDVAAVPLLWVLPLAVYLLTFVLAFGRRTWIPLRFGSWALAVAVIAIAASMLAFRVLPVGFALTLHLTGLFFVGLVCHGRLAAERPAATRLTRFYLVVALGGALGGVFNALVAPLVFDGVWEYPIALVLACALRPVAPRPRPASHPLRARVLDVVVPAGPMAMLAGLYVVLDVLGMGRSPWTTISFVAVAAAGALFLMGRPLRSAVVVALLFVASGLRDAGAMDEVYDQRTFFGVHRVVQFEVPFRTGAPGRERITRVPFRVLYHGATRHGAQILDPRHRGTATTYYHRTGPIGQVFELFGASPEFDSVALVGLGAGTLAAYGRPSQRFTVYELDPEVIRIASDAEFFTFLSDSAAEIEYVPGDGRLSLSRAPDGAYGLIVNDAFSSDAIPVHLLTREAVTLYFDKLREDGILAVHLTNRHVNLEPVVRAIAIDLGLAAIVRTDGIHNEEEMLEGKYESTWALIARRPAALGPLWNDRAWRRLQAAPGSPADDRYLWTDDYSNVLSLIDL
jgi:hypothetical protein